MIFSSQDTLAHDDPPPYQSGHKQLWGSEDMQTHGQTNIQTQQFQYYIIPPPPPPHNNGYSEGLTSTATGPKHLHIP